MSTHKNRTFLTLEVPGKLFYDIQSHANALHVTKSDIVRFALYEYLERYAPALTPVVPAQLSMKLEEVKRNGN